MTGFVFGVIVGWLSVVLAVVVGTVWSTKARYKK